MALTATACGGPASPQADDGRIHVVASFFPLAEAATAVGGERVDVTNLTPPGVEPHDLEITTDDLEAIANADVVLTLGAGFQPAVDEAVATEATGSVVDVLDAIPADARIDGDPHVWLDPALYAAIAERIAGALTDAGAAATAGPFTGELATLDDGFGAGLTTCASRTLLVNHAAFGYLAAAYSLEQVAISGISPEAEPDPARLADLADRASAEGITTVFTESLVSPDVAETLAAEAGLDTAVLNPLEGLTAEQEAAGEGYVSVMRDNLEVLRGGLGCD